MKNVMPTLTLPIAIALALLPGPAAATVEVVKTVRQDGSGDFTSLAAWAAAKGGITDGNLITHDKIAVCRIEGAWTVADTTTVSLAGWTTDPAHYVRIYTAPEARHNGTPNSGYRLVTSNSLHSTVAHLRIEGLDLHGTTNTPVLYCRPGAGTGTGEVHISHCLIHGDGISTSYGIQFYDFTGSTRIFNNLFFNVATLNYTAAISTGDGTNHVYNNTIAGTIGGFGVRSSSSTLSSTYARNNLVRSTAACFYGVFASGSDYNACAGSVTSSGPHDRTNVVFTFVNETARDYHLAANDTGARNQGMNLRYDPDLPVTDDIDGQPRYGAWDAGADDCSSSTPADTLAPSTPGTPTSSTTNAERVVLAWTGSTDDTAVVGYRLFRNDIEIATTPNTTYADTSVLPLTDYQYSVSAFDAAGNESPHSAYASLATPVATDQNGPWLLLVKADARSGTAPVISWVTDEPSSSQVEYGTNTDYGTMTPFSPNRVVTHRVHLPPMPDPGTNHFRVRSRDAAGNESISADYSFIMNSALGHTRYLDNRHPSASDTNPGTASQPWLTLQHAFDVAQPGDTVIVKPGSYERVTVTNSGLPGNYITVRGEHPPDRSHVDFAATFNPAVPQAFPGNPATNAVCRGFSFYPGNNQNVPTAYVRVENFEITAVYQPGQPFPGRGAVYIAGRSGTGTTALVESIEFVNNFLHDANARSNAYDYIAIRGDSHFTRNILIQSNTVFRCQGTGIALLGSLWLVENNDVSHTLDSNTDSGIEVGGDSDACRFFGHHHIIRNNHFHDCLDTEQAGAPHIDAFQTFSVYPDSQYAHDILVEGNRCENMGQMLMSEDSAETAGITNAVHDLIFRNNIFRGARAFAIIVGADHFTFVNNVVADSTYGPLQLINPMAYHGFSVNNLFYNNNSGPGLSALDLVSDYNLFYPDYTVPSKRPEFDKHSLFGVNPQFADATNGDYRLNIRSPGVDRGRTLAQVPSDAHGIPRPLDSDKNGTAAPDLGPYELVDGLDYARDLTDLHIDPTAITDTDGDRMPDAREIIAGTDPTDPASLLTIQATRTGPTGETALSWPTVEGRCYTLTEATRLHPDPDWTSRTASVALGPRMTHTNSPTGLNGFLQIRVRR